MSPLFKIPIQSPQCYNLKHKYYVIRSCTFMRNIYWSPTYFVTVIRIKKNDKCIALDCITPKFICSELEVTNDFDPYKYIVNDQYKYL